MGQESRLSVITRAVATGEEVAEAARGVREDLRWTVARDNTDRQARIAAAMEEIRHAMAPIRAEIGRLIWEPIPAEQEKALRAVSQSLQYERKQLKKMRA